MKKIILLFLTGIALVSCGKDVEFNNPAMQSRLNDTFWKATSFTASKSAATGQLTITGNAAVGAMFLKTASVSKGTYVLGTINQTNRASYDRADGSGSTAFSTEVTLSSVNKILLSAPGTGYTDANLVTTTGGSGSGLKVNITTNAATGAITAVVVNASGDGYRAGDLITITGGNNNAKITVQNVLKSNGEIQITENTGTTISGNYKFTAFDAVSGETIQCRDGIFYKIPLTLN